MYTKTQASTTSKGKKSIKMKNRKMQPQVYNAIKPCNEKKIITADNLREQIQAVCSNHDIKIRWSTPQNKVNIEGDITPEFAKQIQGLHEVWNHNRKIVVQNNLGNRWYTEGNNVDRVAKSRPVQILNSLVNQTKESIVEPHTETLFQKEGLSLDREFYSQNRDIKVSIEVTQAPTLWEKIISYFKSLFKND